MTNNKENIYLKFNSTLFFLLSPFLSTPIILKGVYNKNKRSLVLFVLLIGIISYLYIPSIQSDKAYYYKLYQEWQFFSLKEFFIVFLQEKTDYIFYILIYFFSTLKIPLHFLFFILTTITTGIWYHSFIKLLNKYPTIEKKLYFLFFLVILFSFSLPGLLSGIRFYLAISLVFYGFAFSFVFKEKKIRSFLLILLGVFTHFSCFVFLLVFIALKFKPNAFKAYYYIFVFSFVFLLLPRDFLLNMISNLPIPDLYEVKTTGYLGESDFVLKSLEIGNQNNALRVFFFSLWTYIAYYYLFYFRRNKSLLRNSLFMVMTICNVFYSAPTIYNRYIILALGLFILLLLKENIQGVKNMKVIYTLLLVLSLNFVGNVYSMRQSFVSSIKEIHSLTLPTLLMKQDINYNDIR